MYWACSNPVACFVGCPDGLALASAYISCWSLEKGNVSPACTNKNQHYLLFLFHCVGNVLHTHHSLTLSGKQESVSRTGEKPHSSSHWSSSLWLPCAEAQAQPRSEHASLCCLKGTRRINKNVRKGYFLDFLRIRHKKRKSTCHLFYLWANHTHKDEPV